MTNVFDNEKHKVIDESRISPVLAYVAYKAASRGYCRPLRNSTVRTTIVYCVLGQIYHHNSYWTGLYHASDRRCEHGSIDFWLTHTCVTFGIVCNYCCSTWYQVPLLFASVYYWIILFFSYLHSYEYLL